MPHYPAGELSSQHNPRPDLGIKTLEKFHQFPSFPLFFSLIVQSLTIIVGAFSFNSVVFSFFVKAGSCILQNAYSTSQVRLREEPLAGAADRLE